MRKLKNVAAIARTLLVAAVLVAPQLATALEQGSQAPQLELPTATGAVSLEQLRGRVVYVDFWASWCVPCRQSFPWMNEMQQKYGAQGFQIIAVNVDANPEDRKKFLAAVRANFEVAFDPKGAMAKKFEVKGMPSSVLIGRDGKLVLQHIGFNDAARGKLETSIQSALEARP